MRERQEEKICWYRDVESPRKRNHRMRGGFLISTSYASEVAPLLKACSERDARTACIFSNTPVPTMATVGNETVKEARVTRGPRKRCEFAANAGTSFTRAESKVSLGKRIKSTSNFHERSMRCWCEFASVVPPWFTPSMQCSTFSYPLAVRLPYILRPSTFHSSASRTRSPARVRTSRQPRIEFIA